MTMGIMSLIHGPCPCHYVRNDQNGEDRKTSAESSYITQLRALHSNNTCPSSAFGYRLDRDLFLFDKVVPLGRQEAIRPDSDEDCIRIGEFPCYSHYAERLARLKQVPIFKVLVLPSRDPNHVEPRPTGQQASALNTRPHMSLIRQYMTLPLCEGS